MKNLKTLSLHMTVLHNATFHWTHTTSYSAHISGLVKSLNTASLGFKLIMHKPSLFISISLNFMPINQTIDLNKDSYPYCWASIIPHIDKLYPSSFEQWSKVMCLIALNSPHILEITCRIYNVVPIDFYKLVLIDFVTMAFKNYQYFSDQIATGDFWGYFWRRW